MTPLLAFLAVPFDVASPNGLVIARFALDAAGRPTLAVDYRGKPMLAPGRMGLDLASGGPLNAGLYLVGTDRQTKDETWRAVAGKSSLVRDHYRQTTFRLIERGESPRRLEVVVRAYDDGVAFRYVVQKQPNLTDFYVREELTEFRLVGKPKATALVLPNERTPYEELYQTGPLKNGSLIGFPLLLQYPSGTAIALTEADLMDYPGLYLRPQGGVLKGHLSPRLDDSGLAVKAELPHATPWRVVMVGDPKRLLESNLVLNLNPPSMLKDTSWIKPGKTTFPWWNGYNTGKTGIRPAQTTEYHKWCIDFCAKHKIPYHSLDGLDNVAWYGGPIVPYAGAEITKGLPGLDVPEVLRYAKSKGVRIRVWMSSAAAKAQMAKAYPEYERMGIEGVMVDFFDRDDQDTVNLVRDVVALAARCHLTVTLHNLYKPTGLQRTYPNLLTFEAARNLEFDKWDPKGITPEHELNVAFVRQLAGPIDFHSGSFQNVLAKDFKPVDKSPKTIGTRARQLARYVIYEGALPMIADSPAVYDASPAGLSLLVEVPTTWDETRVLAGEVGRSIVVARRKGRVWYVGAMTDSKARSLTVPLSFLGKGKFRVESWLDAPGGPTKLARTTGVATGSVTIKMNPAGGAAMRFTPVR